MNFKVNRGMALGDSCEGVTFKFPNGASLSMQSSKSHRCTPGESVELHAWGPHRERVNLMGREDTVGWVRVEDLPFFIRKVKRWKPSAKCGATTKNPCINPHCRQHGKEVA
jgi:hypothetical protein